MNLNETTFGLNEIDGAVCTKPFDAENARHADGDDPCNRGES